MQMCVCDITRKICFSYFVCQLQQFIFSPNTETAFSTLIPPHLVDANDVFEWEYYSYFCLPETEIKACILIQC